MEYTNRILDHVLNINGVDYFAHTPLTNYSGGYIANMLFYNTQKLAFHSATYVTTAYRDINFYKMYYRSHDLNRGDTIFMTFIIAHLKAGSYENNVTQRYMESQQLMAKVVSMGIGNYVLSGDFNLYGANEPAYQHFIHYPNSLYNFYDPINEEGEWNNNRNYAHIHTQSTHTTSDGCFSTGGMDDRFDFILVSPYIYYGSARVQSINESYRALGQDGNRFNGSIISPANSAVPDNIARALYNQSDHLPVIMDFEISASTGINHQESNIWVNVINPVSQVLKMMVQVRQEDQYLFEIYSMDGKQIASFQQFLSTGMNDLQFDFPFPASLYLLKISNLKSALITKKIIKISN
ncbi:MAG: T9SS type A sorting domain-containing protein [Bacteroidales bacterium]